jgi:hypothetical protein
MRLLIESKATKGKFPTRLETLELLAGTFRFYSCGRMYFLWEGFFMTIARATAAVAMMLLTVLTLAQAPGQEDQSLSLAARG